MMPYRQLGELKTFAFTVGICCLPNSVHLMPSSNTVAEESYVPIVVVVFVEGPMIGSTPYGKHDSLIIVPVLPESISTAICFCRGIPCIVCIVTKTVGDTSC